MSARPSHLRAQDAVVRMLFDPEFAAAVRRDPDRVLAGLEPSLRRQLAAVDPRAFKLDRLRRRRALRTLSEEFKGSTTLALAETRQLAFLETFFASTPFHQSVEERGSMPLAFAQFLAEALAEGRLRSPLLPSVLAIETGLARARRDARLAPSVPPDQVMLAPGVLPIETTQGALATLQQAEHYLFEVGLMPAVALCDDAPALELDGRTRDAAPLHLVTVPNPAGVSLVAVDDEYARLLRAFDGRARTPAALLSDAAARGLPEARGRALLDELIADEIALRGAR